MSFEFTFKNINTLTLFEIIQQHIPQTWCRNRKCPIPTVQVTKCELCEANRDWLDDRKFDLTGTYAQ